MDDVVFVNPLDRPRYPFVGARSGILVCRADSGMLSGSFETGNVARINRSIVFTSPFSFGRANDIACPLPPARPVRPIRCT